MPAGSEQVRDFLGLQGGTASSSWRLPIAEKICGGAGNLYGGCGLAAVIEAAEGASGKPTAWATCQFVGAAAPPAVVDLEAEIVAAGHRMSQIRVLGTVAGELFLTGLVAVGRREERARGIWESMPDVPAPEDCPPRRMVTEEHRGGLRPRIDERTATTGPDGFLQADELGRSAVWATMPGGVPGVASALAVLGDNVSIGVSALTESDVRARSIDNTIRIVEPTPTPWVLADIKIHSVADGLGHGNVNLWSQQGDLLAVSSQSGMVGPR